MKISFSIEYITNYGEELRLQCDGWEKPMSTTDGRIWTTYIDWTAEQPPTITYRYAMYRDGQLVWTEWTAHPHRLFLHDGNSDYDVVDVWRPIPENLPLYSSAYTSGLSLCDESLPPTDGASVSVELRTSFPPLQPGERLAMMSSLNGWTTPYDMAHLGFHEWGIRMPADVAEYKFVIVRNGRIVEWESGNNRWLPQVVVSSRRPRVTLVQTVGQVRLSRPDWRVAGVVIPVFSLRTANSQGIGDFGDLMAMVRWAASVGMHAVQVLPVNDTNATGTFTDSYPYNAISCYALNPAYCDLSQLSLWHDFSEDVERLRAEAVMLNALAQVDYVAVSKLKMDFLRRVYDAESNHVLRTREYRGFEAEMWQWLVPYAVYCFLRDKFGTSAFAKWPTVAKYSREEAEALFNGKERREIRFYCFVQYILHCQLTAVSNEAARLGVILKGDIPIGVNPESVEVWTEPWLFNMDSAAGAPPDAFSADGQNWGFPTYNWTMMAKDDYAWWRKRLSHMARYFTAYRIDHVLGFFRIWQIPAGRNGKAVSGMLGQFVPALPMSANEIAGYGFHFEMERQTWPYVDNVDEALFVRDYKDINLVHPRISAQGSSAYRTLDNDQRRAYDALCEQYFYHRHNEFWRQSAMSKLPALVQCTSMLACAEDLGMVPACVPGVMESLRILSLEIQSMPKAFGCEFAALEANPWLSVATIATHDMPTMRGWWQEDGDRAQRFWNNVLHHGGDAPRQMPAWLADDIVWRHLTSPSMLCLVSLQDWLATDETLRCPDPDAERINVPANKNHYWRYRMHLTIEDLSHAEEFCKHVKQTIKASGR